MYFYFDWDSRYSVCIQIMIGAAVCPHQICVLPPCSFMGPNTDKLGPKTGSLSATWSTLLFAVDGRTPAPPKKPGKDWIPLRIPANNGSHFPWFQRCERISSIHSLLRSLARRLSGLRPGRGPAAQGQVRVVLLSVIPTESPR